MYSAKIQKSSKPIAPSDVTPGNKVNKFKETCSQNLMNYEIKKKDKVMANFKPTTPAPQPAQTKKAVGQRKLIDF